MAVRDILVFPHAALSVAGEPVDPSSPALGDLVRDLIETMYASPGVGLAAPQIGISQRVAVIDVSRRRATVAKPTSAKNHGLLILLNPVIVEKKGTQVPREGCLSLPDLLANVTRFQEVAVRYQVPDGRDRLISAEGFEALALQHEVDHLDGKLFIERVSNLKTDTFRRTQYD